ncbi:MAG: DinB family protein [Phycisphaerales bacterium JB043]
MAPQQDVLDRICALVGEREPLDVLSQTPRELTRIITQHDEATLRARPFEGKWTPLEIIGHLIDHEIVSTYRQRIIRFADDPVIQAYNQEGMVTTLRYNEADPPSLLERFERMRAFNLSEYATLTHEELERVGRHTRRGEVSLAFVLRSHAGHDLHHIDQINRYVQAALEANA